MKTSSLTENAQQKDIELTRSAESQVNWPTTPADEIIQIAVKDGWITLQGEVERNFRKAAAESDVSRLPGVKGVTNLITLRIKEGAEAITGIAALIEAAFVESHQLNSENIQVKTSGNSVTLCGHVQNLVQFEEAERIVRATPGVVLVNNQLVLNW